MELYREIYHPTENYLYKVCQEFEGTYYEDGKTIKNLDPKLNSKAKTQTAVFNYQNLSFKAISSKVNNRTMIILNLNSEQNEYFKIMPNSALTIFDKIKMKIKGNSITKNIFVFRGGNEFGNMLKGNKKFCELYQGNEYVIELDKEKRQILKLIPFHGISNYQELLTCLELLIVLDYLLKIKMKK